MRTFPRRAWKIVWWTVAALLFMTGVWGIPGGLAEQYAFLSSLGGEWLITILVLLLGFVLALLPIEPQRVRAWVRWAVGLEATSRSEAEELRHDYLQLSTKLNQLMERWLAEYREAEAREPTSQVQRQLQSWDIALILNRARRKYNKNFYDRAVRLFELAEARGWGRTPLESGG